MKTDNPIASWTFKKREEKFIIVPTMAFVIAAIMAVYSPTLPVLIILFIVTAIWILVLYFFRDPDRDVIDELGLVVGPCDGTVADIAHVQEEQYLHAEVVRVGIFLSVFNVHVQRAPIAGEVTSVEYQPGKFLPAFSPQASTENEYIAMSIKTNYGIVLIKQISGILARRCVNFAQPGDQVLTGQRFGLIKFGSRVEIFLPPDAEILVSIGDKVTGGLTKMAQLTELRKDYEK
ncbi:MAG: phosphatidylserine decarboxylase family protein [Chloroflexota bacterium]|nr:MAG: phosphatidylserine decarboxylase family protein [Chloroflexota bacterium]